MIINVYNYVNHMPEGDYRGHISAVSVSNDNRYLWFKVAIENETAILNISLPISSFLFNNFAKNFVEADGEVETDNFLNVLIDFNIEDKDVYGQTYSRFTRLEPVFEEEEENEN